jgi:chlorite dismutase
MAEARPETVRQVVKYNFYQVDPLWRRLPDEERKAHREEFDAVVAEFSGRIEIRPYSLVGLRAEVDFLLWILGWTLEEMQEFSAAVNATGLGKYLKTAYSYLSLSRPSPYVDDHEHEGQEGRQKVIRPQSPDHPYLVVYPFAKTAEWYQLPLEERQRMMNEHFEVGHKYPGVRNNTSYSFGIDDQEHVVAFDVSNIDEFLELLMELREAEARPFTERDTPIFTCIAGEIDDILAALG